jgi:hypothetical protein
VFDGGIGPEEVFDIISKAWGREVGGGKEVPQATEFWGRGDVVDGT